jgi:predicted NBD/HSP70 family sugar kinase
MPELTLGVDLSEIAARVALVTAGGEVVARAELPQASAGRSAGLRDAARRVIAAAGGPVSAVAVALPTAGEDLPAEVASALKAAAPGAAEPAVIAAGTAAAIAEHWCGAARPYKQVVTFALGEHVTAGVLINGEPWHGAHGLAGSVGWLALNPVEREDYRRYGGLEAEVSAAGIVRRLVWRIKSGDHSTAVDHAGGDLARITPEDVFREARAGDGVCISVVRDTARYVGMAIANLAAILDPEVIVLGGILASSGDMMFDAIGVECSRRLRPAQAAQVHIVLSTLGADAVALGAARAASPVPA